MIERVGLVDDRTVTFVTEYPFGAFEPTMAHVSAAILNPATIAAHGRELGYSDVATSGTGPYRVVWGARISNWCWSGMTTTGATRGSWRGSSTDPFRTPPRESSPSRQARQTSSRTCLRRTSHGCPQTPEVAVLRKVSIGARGFRFHMKRPPFTDARVRQAISYAIDRQSIVDHLFPGQAVVSTGALTPIMRGYADLGRSRTTQIEPESS